MTPATVLGGMVGESAAKLIVKLWPFAVMAGLVVALLLTRATLADVKDERDAANQALGSERTRHAVTRQSVTALEGTIATLNEEARRRAAEFEAAKAAAAKEVAAADARYAATEARRAYLADLAARKPDKACPVPPGLLDALEGL